MANSTRVTVSLLRESRASDGAGGKAVFQNSVGSFEASIQFYSRESLTHLESLQGVQAEELRLFTVREHPYPPVLLNDILEIPEGTRYRVIQPPRCYRRTMQIDARVMR